ncbi:hypothetical protein K6118_02555 [Kordiimonas sp. A6E486]|nr:hypothetical protein [Kordiimonas marina]
MNKTIKRQGRKGVTRTLAVAIGLSAMAYSAPAFADVDIQFSDQLATYMGDIDRAEKDHEKVFRKYRVESSSYGLKPRAGVNKSRRSQIEWANERLFPNVDDYNVEALFTAMLDRGLKAADPNFAGKLVVSINKMRISDFPVAVIRLSHRSQISGTVKVYDASGKLVADHKVTTSLHPKRLAAAIYKGPDYAYAPLAQSTRVGPLAAQFTEKVLETLYPKYDAPGPVIIN